MIFNAEDFDDHEQVVFCCDAESGLQAIIAIHNTGLGPALGGCRVWDYPSEEAAVCDVLRLSKGMSYKNAVAGIPFGGGKSVVLAAREAKTPAMMRALGQAIEQLGGRYITGEDIGTTVTDMLEIRQQTAHAKGLPIEVGGGGDPSPSTALGCFVGVQAALMQTTGARDVSGKTVAIQGLGNVGFNLAKLLHQDGAKLIVADIDPDRVDVCVHEFGATSVSSETIHKATADVFSPCAMGAVINDDTIDELAAPIIAGGANNQLHRTDHGEALRERSILYAPDYAINAGGVIHLSYEQDKFDAEAARAQVCGIYDTLIEIFKNAEKDEIATSEAADRLARQRIGSKKITD